ncbi:MAG: FecR family protein, partial [bacterium]
MFRKIEIHIAGAAVSAALAAGIFLLPLSWAQPASSGGMTKRAFVQRYFLNKLKRPAAARKYVPAGMDKLSPGERYQAVARALAREGVTILLESRPEQPLSRVEYITLTHLLAGGSPGSSFARQKAFLKSRGVLDKSDIGHIKAFQGDITITRDGRKKSIKLTGAEPVLFRDLDETDFGARLELQLDDGSNLIIDEDTALKIDEMIYDPKTNRRSVSLRLTVGKIRVKVSKNNTPGSKFQIITPTTVTGVRGTEFTVSVDEWGKTRVITLEGAVTVRPVDKRERRPTSRAEQRQGAPPEQGTREIDVPTS